MPLRATNESSLREAVSVTQMARMLGLSRASFYSHVQRGTMLAPIYALNNRRPIYTAEMQQKNLDVRATQKGVNGEYVLFYERGTAQTAQNPSRRRTPAVSVPSDLRRRLEGLGLNGLSDLRVEQAFAACFPQGAVGVAEPDVLRSIYRHLRRSDAV